MTGLVVRATDLLGLRRHTHPLIRLDFVHAQPFDGTLELVAFQLGYQSEGA